MLKLNVNRKMSTEELQTVHLEAKQDYVFYIKAYRILCNNHNPKHKQAKKALKLAKYAEKRYATSEALLSNR